MNKEIAIVITLPCMLFISLEIFFPTVKADFNESIVFSGGVTVYSPINTTYHSNSLTLNLTCGCGAGLDIFLNYDVDGKYQGPISLTFNVTYGFHLIGLGTGLVKLPELPMGTHCLTIYEEAYLYDYYGASPPGPPFEQISSDKADFVASWVDRVYFTIDSNMNASGLETSDSLIPSRISAIPSPLAEPTPTEELQQTEQDTATGAVFAVTSIVVFMGSLFYFIKRRQFQQNLRN